MSCAHWCPEHWVALWKFLFIIIVIIIFTLRHYSIYMYNTNSPTSGVYICIHINWSREAHTNLHRHRHTNTHAHVCTHTHVHTHTHADRQTFTQTHSYRHREWMVLNMYSDHISSLQLLISFFCCWFYCTLEMKTINYQGYRLGMMICRSLDSMQQPAWYLAAEV